MNQQGQALGWISSLRHLMGVKSGNSLATVSIVNLNLKPNEEFQSFFSPVQMFTIALIAEGS